MHLDQMVNKSSVAEKEREWREGSQESVVLESWRNGRQRRSVDLGGVKEVL